jgi:hypothetical protein
MIEVKIRFWTDGIAEGEDMILPRNAWAAGVVRIERNDSHDLIPDDPVPFNSLMEIPGVIERVLIAHGITLHSSRKMNRYFSG